MKLTLNLDALQVESFDTLPGDRRARGTVRGHDAAADYNTHVCSKDFNTCRGSCDPCATCDTSCAGGPLCDCMPSGCVSCQTSCAGGPLCDCAPTPACPTS
jgi:hypothetical protein